MEGYVQGALQKELRIAPFVFGKVLLMNFASTWNNLLKHCVFADFFADRLFTGCSTTGALLLSYTTLKQLLWESLTDTSFHYLEQFT